MTLRDGKQEQSVFAFPESGVLFCVKEWYRRSGLIQAPDDRLDCSAMQKSVPAKCCANLQRYDPNGFLMQIQKRFSINVSKRKVAFLRKPNRRRDRFLDSQDL